MATFTTTCFGEMLELNISKEFDLALICIDTTIGHQPKRLCLSHQVYRHTLKALLAQHPEARSITIIPIRSTDKINRITITETDL